MNILKNIERIQMLHKLIKEEKTGTPDSLSRRLDISRASLYNLLEELKSIDAPILYSRQKETFYYATPFDLDIYFRIQHLKPIDLKKINGGLNLFNFRLFF